MLRRFVEEATETMVVHSKMKSILFEGKTDFQTVQVIETHQFGKMLILDSKTQSAELDEHTYHESLVHPAMFMHPNPKRVFIGGGGEFATAREVLKHTSVEQLVMVDIDETVCNMCRKWLPEWNDGAYEDPRMETYHDDAKAWLERFDGKFDVIIMDIADPIEAGPGIALYTKEFYESLEEKLSPGGVFVSQSGPGGMYNYDECFSSIHQTLRASFDCVVPFTSFVPSFVMPWGFNMAFRAPEGMEGKAAEKAVRGRTEDEVDALIEARLKGGAATLQHLDGETWQNMMNLPRQTREGLAAEKRIITKDTPVFMY